MIKKTEEAKAMEERAKYEKYLKRKHIEEENQYLLDKMRMTSDRSK